MNSAEQPLLALRGVQRTYQSGSGPLPVLRGVDLDLWPGEMVGLIGPSGSGKSSLLHAAGLLEHPNAGQVWLSGKECSNLSDRARTRLRLSAIGFVYQFHHLLPEFDAQENVAIPLMIAGAARHQARERAGELLGQLGLEKRLDHRPAELSGGEQQRVAIARALANRPSLLLADEPTGNLDPDTAAAVFQSLQNLVRQQGVSALIATHNLQLAGYMDRVFTLRDGHLEPWSGPKV